MVNRIAAIVMAVLVAAAAPSGKAEFDEGRRLYLAGAYAEALPYLERAHALSKGRPSTIEALALCYEKLERDDDALVQYRALLDADPDRADATRAKIREIEAKIAARDVLEPSTTPPPAREIDNFAARRDAAPPPSIAPPPPVAAPEDDGPPWLWITVGAVAVVAAGVAVVAVSTSGGEALPPSLDRRFER